MSLQPSPICDCDEFIARNKNKYGCDFSKTIIGRDNDIEKLSNMIVSSDVVVVTGDSGIGKTRLVLESLKRIKKDAVVVENKIGDVISDLSLTLSKDKQSVVLFDDANSVSHLEQCIDAVLQTSPSAKLVLTVRSYAKEKVINIIQKFKLTTNFYKVDRITDDDIRKIIEINYLIRNRDYQDRIIRISNGNARLAVIACEKVVSSQGSNAFLWNDSASLLSGYFHDVINKKEGLDYEKKRDLLGILSTLKRIDIDDDNVVSKISVLTNLSTRDVKCGYLELFRLEIVDIYEDRVAKVSDQCLEDYFAYEVFVESKSITLKDIINNFFESFSGQVVDTINSIICIYTSESGNAYVKKQIIEVWDYLEANNKLNIKFVSAFAALDGDRATEWCAKHLFAGKTRTEEELIVDDNMYYERNDYLSILERVFENEKDTVSISYILDSLSYSELREHAAGIIKRAMILQPEDFKDNFNRQSILMESLENYSNERWFSALSCAACMELLKFNYTFTKYTKKDSLQYYSLVLSDDYVACNAIRNKAWRLLQLVDKKDGYHLIYDYFNSYPNDAKMIFLNDVDNINAVLKLYDSSKNLNELLIYGRSFFHFFSIGCKWEYMEKRYADEKDDLVLILNPKEDDMSTRERKTEWELRVEKRAKNDNSAKSIELLTRAMALLELVDEYKIKTFIFVYLSYNSNETVTEWSFDNIQRVIEKLDSRGFYLLATKIKDIEDLQNRIESTPSDYYKKELIAAFLLKMQDMGTTNALRDLLALLFQYDFSKPNNNISVNRRMDIIWTMSVDNNEFISYLSLINDNYTSNSVICNEYYSILFNPCSFEMDALFEVFKDKLQILETAFLNHLSSGLFHYKVSDYYFSLCNRDPCFFERTIGILLSNEKNVQAIELLWKQNNHDEYASIIFDNLIGKVENDYICSMNFAHYFALGAHHDSDKNNDAIIRWAKNMVNDISDTLRIQHLSKIVAETNSGYIVEFISHLINLGIGLEAFSSLSFEPLISSFDSAVQHMEKRITLYKEILLRIENKANSREIISTIKKTIEGIQKCIVETKIYEALDYNN